MPDLVIRPSKWIKGKPWVLQLRYYDTYERPEYVTLMRMSKEIALDFYKAGKPFFLFGSPEEYEDTVNEQLELFGDLP